MAIGIENTDNVDAPNVDYPYGKVRDDSGANDGTPANTKTLGDFHQFFARLLAESGITANATPDNLTNTFQYYRAFLKAISLRVGIYTDAENLDVYSYDLNQYTNAGVYGVSNYNFLSGPSGMGSNCQMTVSGRGDTAVIQVLTDLDNGAQWVRYFTYPSTWTSWSLIKYASKRFIIPAWNMDADDSISFAHGLSNFKKAIGYDISIRNDNDTTYYVNAGIEYVGFSSTTVEINRIDSGIFDAVGHQSTSFPRGILVVRWEP